MPGRGPDRILAALLALALLSGSSPAAAVQAVVERVETAQADFRQGTLVNVAATANGDLQLVKNPALKFNGISSYLTVAPSQPSLPFTIEFWAKPSDPSPVGMFDTASRLPYALRNYSGGRVEWWNTNPNLSLGTTAGSWQHLAFVFRQTNVNIIEYYRNGIPVATATGSSATTFAWTSPIRFGDINHGDAGRYNGLLKDIRIWNTARTQAEIQGNMNRALAGAEPGLLGYWKLSEGGGTTAYDSTANKKHGTIYNAAWDTSSYYAFSGTRTSPPLDLSPVSSATGSSISWNATTPAGTGIVVETSLDGGGTWRRATKGGTIPGIDPGDNLAGKGLLVRQTLSTAAGTATPLLHDLTVRVEGAPPGSPGRVTVTAEVRQEIEMSLSTTIVSLGAVNPSLSPYVIPAAVSIRVRSNVPWAAQHSLAPLKLPDGSQALPGLAARQDGGGYQAIPDAPVSMAAGAATAGTEIRFDYRQEVPWNALPGPYSGTVSYIAVGQ